MEPAFCILNMKISCRSESSNISLVQDLKKFVTGSGSRANFDMDPDPGKNDTDPDPDPAIKD